MQCLCERRRKHGRCLQVIKQTNCHNHHKQVFFFFLSLFLFFSSLHFFLTSYSTGILQSLCSLSPPGHSLAFFPALLSFFLIFILFFFFSNYILICSSLLITLYPFSYRSLSLWSPLQPSVCGVQKCRQFPASRFASFLFRPLGNRVNVQPSTQNPPNNKTTQKNHQLRFSPTSQLLFISRNGRHETNHLALLS